jgi:hypothetical protein
MSIMLVSYKTTYKVVTWYTPYQLMYGLHSLMPTKYMVLVGNGNEISFLYIYCRQDQSCVECVFQL